MTSNAWIPALRETTYREASQAPLAPRRADYRDAGRLVPAWGRISDQPDYDIEFRAVTAFAAPCHTRSCGRTLQNGRETRRNQRGGDRNI